MNRLAREWKQNIKEYLNKHNVKATAAGSEVWARNAVMAKKQLIEFLGDTVVEIGTAKSIMTFVKDETLLDLIVHVFESNYNEKLDRAYSYYSTSREVLKHLHENSVDGRLIRDFDNEYLYQFMKTYNPKFREPRKGMKLSKILSGWLSSEEVNIHFSKLVQEAKDMTIHIGVRPTDFLSMSDGNNWNSCHSIRNGGCYQTGGASMMVDKVSLVAWAGKWEDKKWRQMVYLDVNSKTFVTSRSYPFVHKAASDLIEDFIKEKLFAGLDMDTDVSEYVGQDVIPLLDHDFYWSDYDEEWRLDETEYFYHDIMWGYTNGVVGYTAMEYSEPVLPIGGRPTCPICGEWLDDHDEITCCRPTNTETCPRCGGLFEDLRHTSNGHMCYSCYRVQELERRESEQDSRVRQYRNEVNNLERDNGALRRMVAEAQNGGNLRARGATAPPSAHSVPLARHLTQDVEFEIMGDYEAVIFSQFDVQIPINQASNLIDTMRRTASSYYDILKIENMFYGNDNRYYMVGVNGDNQRLFITSDKTIQECVISPASRVEYNEIDNDAVERTFMQFDKALEFIREEREEELFDIENSRFAWIADNGEPRVDATAPDTERMRSVVNAALRTSGLADHWAAFTDVGRSYYGNSSPQQWVVSDAEIAARPEAVNLLADEEEHDVIADEVEENEYDAPYEDYYDDDLPF